MKCWLVAHDIEEIQKEVLEWVRGRFTVIILEDLNGMCSVHHDWLMFCYVGEGTRCIRNHVTNRSSWKDIHTSVNHHAWVLLYEPHI